MPSAAVVIVGVTLTTKDKFSRRQSNHIFSIVIGVLTFTALRANSADDKLIIFFLVFQKTGFDISCKLHEMSKPCFWEK